jgi:hypothetical protein
MSESQPTAEAFSDDFRSICNSSINIPRPSAVILSISYQFEALTVAFGLDELPSSIIEACPEISNSVLMNGRSRNSSLDTAMGYGLDGRGSIPGIGNVFFSTPSAQTCSAPHPASYPMRIGGSFPGGNAVGAWSWPLTSIQCLVQEWCTCTPYVFMAQKQLYVYLLNGTFPSACEEVLVVCILRKANIPLLIKY